MSGAGAVNRPRMRLGLLGVLLLGACANAPSTTSMEEANVAAARRLLEEPWNNRNMGVIAELHTPDAVSYTNGVRDTLSAEAFVTATLQTYPDSRVEVEDVFGAGDRVVLRWSWTATAAPATTKATIHGMSVSRFVDGKVVESHDFYDVLAFTLATGATITPASPPATTTSQ